MEKKSAAERQDNFSHFSLGGQRREMCEEVEHDNVMSRGGQEEIRLAAGARRKREERTREGTP